MSASICIWSDLSYEEVSTINSCEWTEDVRHFLCIKFGFQPENLSLKDNAIIDLFYYTLLFAKDNNFNAEQTSALFSIMKRIHVKTTETSFGNIKETFEYFRALLGCHSVKRPPFCVRLYNLNEINLISAYVQKTYFRHFKLYKYAFTPKVVLNLKVSYNGCEEDTPNVKEESLYEEETSNNKQTADQENCIAEKEAEEVAAAIKEETPAVKELKQLIESSLDEHVKKLRLNVEEKLKNNEALMVQLAKESSKSLPSKSTKGGKKQ